MRSSRAGTHRQGFSLLEVLIAMFVLSIGAASVLALFAAAASTHKRSVDRTHAALLAERVFSEVSGRYLPGMSAEELQEMFEEEVRGSWTEDGDEDGEGSYRWELYLFHPARSSKFATGRRSSRGDERESKGWSEDELFARVIVRWKQKAYARSQTFHKILLPRNAKRSDDRRSGSRRGGSGGLIR